MAVDWHPGLADGALCARRLDVSFDGRDNRAAREVCAACSIRERCRDWARSTGQAGGVFGGETEAERRRYLGVRPGAPIGAAGAANPSRRPL